MQARLTTRWTTAVAVVIVGLLGLLAGLLAAPAGAATVGTDPNPASVPASVTVGSFLTMNLPGAQSIAFGSVAPGTTAGSFTMDGSNPTYVPLQVATNDPAGYSMTVSAADFSGGGLLASDLSMSALSPSGTNYTTTTPVAMPEGGQSVTFGSDTMAAPNPDSWGTAWKLTVPLVTPAGSFTTTVTYLVVAN
jgi:hypothetical protein